MISAWWLLLLVPAVIAGFFAGKWVVDMGYRMRMRGT